MALASLGICLMFHFDSFNQSIAVSQYIAIDSATGGAVATGKGRAMVSRRRAELTLPALRRMPFSSGAACAFLFQQSPTSWGWQ